MNYLGSVANGCGRVVFKDWIQFQRLHLFLEMLTCHRLLIRSIQAAGSKGQALTMVVFWLQFYAPRIYVCWRHIQRSYLLMYYTWTECMPNKLTISVAVKRLQRINLFPHCYNNQKSPHTTLFTF